MLRLPTVALALVLPLAAAAQPEPIRAARLAGDLRVDGRLDEPGWRLAEPFADFVQSFPDEGRPATERTEVRVLHDDRMLYVGVRCWDSHPDEIVRPLGRRDRPPVSDLITVLVDANSDRRTAALFALSAGGVQADGLVFDDDRVTLEWDAVWEGAVALLPDGWSAEFAIPLSALRFPDVPVQSWGFGVQRETGRSHEKSATVLLPRNGRGLVSRLGKLTGIAGIRPGLDLEWTPYAAARLLHRPLHSDPSLARPRVLDPVGDVGIDLAARLGSRLHLAAAVNPDFGQVEADQILLNLTSFEPFFPEKRPFFNQGLDLFQPPGAGNERVPQQMFYSRRIGLDAPILGAAKLVGRVGDRVQVGLLDAVVTGAGLRDAAAAPSLAEAESRAGRGLRWSASQPFRLAPDRAFPAAEPVGANYLAGVVRMEAAERLQVGLQGTSALPLAAACGLSPADLDTLPENRIPATCRARGGHALAIDLNTTSADGEWYAYGQVAGSRAEGGPTARTLPDGTALRRGDTGLGGYFRAGRRGGEPWRFDLGWSHAAPRLDLNPSGYQRTQNEQEASATLRYTRPSGGGAWHEWTFAANGYGRWTTDGRGRPRGRGVALAAEGLHRPLYAWTWGKLALDDAQYDVREIAGAGVSLRRPSWATLLGGFASDETRPVYLQLELVLSKNLAMAPLPAPWSGSLSGEIALRPHPRLETRLGATYAVNAYAIKHVEDDGTLGLPAGSYLLGSLRAPALSLVLRQLLVVSPRLTVQLYGQLFSAAGRYGAFWTADPGGATVVEPSLLRPVPFPAGGTRPDFHQTRLVLNAVLRWEYRPGATLFLVYARDQSELPWTGEGPAPAAAWPRGLGPGPTTDLLMVKWSWWLAT
jgi:hypothetical protein